MAQEIRLGSSESMKNINLGSTELQEVYLGAILIWRNNVPPFYTVALNGVIVSTNGSIIAPVKPPKPSAVPSNNYEYTSNLNINISNIQEEDQPAGNIIFNLYEGDFESDPTLPVIATFTAVQGGSGTLTIPQGPQPTGATASTFLYTDKLFSISATDTEAGVSIQFLKVTRIDSQDIKNFGGYTNSGGTYNPTTSTSTQTGLSATGGTECYSVTATTSIYNRTTSTPVASQNQTRTCSVQIVGIQDTPARTCTTADQNRTITVTTGTPSSSDVVTSQNSFPNPNFVSGVDVIVPANQTSSSSSSTGGCVAGASPGCGVCVNVCSGTGTITTTTTTTIINRNCAYQNVSTSSGGSTTSTSSCSTSYANPDGPSVGKFSSGFGSNTSSNFSERPGSGTQSGGLPFNFDSTRNGTCVAGKTITSCYISDPKANGTIISGGVGSDHCTISATGIINSSSYDFCGSAGSSNANILVISATLIMNCG